MGAASERTPEAILEDGVRKRKEREKSEEAVKASTKVMPLSQVWKPSQRAQTVTIWTLLVITTFFTIAVVVEELQASWYRSPALNALNSQFYGAPSLDIILPVQDDRLSNGPRTTVLTWNVTKGVGSPDGLRSRVYLVNGEFPGPVVEARPGDVILVNLINSLRDEDLAMAFLDELSGVTRWSSAFEPEQNAMVAAQTEQQLRIQVPPDWTGTFLYRAEDQVQAAGGLFGAFVVHDTSFSPDEQPESLGNGRRTADEERVIVINEWHALSADRASPVSRPALAPSILINGVGNRNCSQLDAEANAPCLQKTGRSRPNMQFVAGKKYRLRLVNAGTTSGVTFTIPGALMVIVEMDGVRVSPQKATSIGVLRPGQTVDVTVDWQAGGDDEFSVVLEDDHADGTIAQSFPIRVSGFISSKPEPPPHRYRDVLRLKPIE